MSLFCSINGAENGTRTRDPNLGKVVLYQLSYFRNKNLNKGASLSIAGAKVMLFSKLTKLFAIFFQKNFLPIRFITIILILHLIIFRVYEASLPKNHLHQFLCQTLIIPSDSIHKGRER